MSMHSRFRKDQRGTTAVIFSLALLPLLGLAGAALDYSRASRAKANLQKAADAAAIALVRDAGRLDAAGLTRQGQKVVDTMLADETVAVVDPVTVTRVDKTIRVRVTGQVATTLMGVLGISSMPVRASAESTWSNKKIELALVLDNTGSMNDVVGGRRKLDELKRSSSDLLRTLNQAAPDNDTIKVSIVPFDTMVRLDPATYRNEPWLRFANAADRANWKGYVTDRDQPYDTGDLAPVAALPASLYPGSTRNDTILSRVQPLVSVVTGYRDLQGTVSSMTASGCTNITVGASWGLATLTNAAPMSGAAAAGAADIEKIMILLTDGDNTQNRWVNACSAWGNASLIDDRTRDACTNVKTAGVRVYTVRLISGNAALLRNCASTGRDGNALYYDVRDTAALNGVFQTIVNEILGTRLTQ